MVGSENRSCSPLCCLSRRERQEGYGIRHHAAHGCPSLHADASARQRAQRAQAGATVASRPHSSHLARPAGHHPQQNPVTSDELMVESAPGVQAGEGEQSIGQQLVNFLCWMKDGRVRGGAEIQLEDAIVEPSPVPNARHDPHDRNEEHQDVEQVMHGERCSAAELADIRPKVRRLVRDPPENPRDHRGKRFRCNDID
jgi:hypothetical protein